jgi:hypothetical protein
MKIGRSHPRRPPEIAGSSFVSTGHTEEEPTAAVTAARQQIASYGATSLPNQRYIWTRAVPTSTR